MKKLFSVMLVLALCGFASAAVDIYIVDANTGLDEITVAPSDYFDLLIYYTGDDVISFDSEVDATGPGTILDNGIAAAILATGRNSEYDMYNYPGPTYDIEVGASADSGALGKTLSAPLAKISFHCEGNGDVTIDLYDVAVFSPDWSTQILVGEGLTYHGMIIHQYIPEPATIALLCLGGLLLRKKR